MDTRGSIAHFETKEDAKRAGYDLLLSKQEVLKAMLLPRDERRQFVESSRKVEKNRNKAKAARRARRAGRK